MDNLIKENRFQDEETDNLKKELSYYLFFWPWFLAFTTLVLVVTFFMLRYENRVYEANAQIQIKEGDDASSFLTGGATTTFSWFDRVNIENHVAVMTSKHILTQVVHRLNLQTSTYTYGSIVGSLRNTLLFEKQLPINVELKKNDNNLALEFEVIDDKLIINKGETSYTIKKGEVLDTKDFFIQPKDSLFLKDREFKIVHRSLDNSVVELKQSISVEVTGKRSEIVDINIKGINRDRNKAILNTLIQVLAEDQITDKREISKLSIDFIDNRLEGLTKSIDTISNNTINFQKDNDIYQPYIQTENALTNIINDQKEIFALEIQLEITNALLEKLEAQSNFDILPANVGIENENVNSLVNQYNINVTKRNSLLTSASENNPIIVQLTKGLQNAKAAINSGVKRYIESLKISLARYQELEIKTRKRVAELPSKENTLRTYARNFKLVEELYVFLLKRKEEASISYISALPNLKILSYGVSNNNPISPNVQTTYLIAILFGLFVPFVILFLLKFFDTKINTRDDLVNGLPEFSVLGEVPLDENYNTSNYQERGIIAESTRVIRSSVSFLVNDSKSQVILTTSTTKGEGKSFMSYNIAKSYSSLGKKVILIGADLRNPQLHNLLGIERGNLGLSTFLNDVNYNDLDKLILKAKSINEMDYLFSGSIPPNPSELLMRPRMKELLEKLKLSYDIIILDTAPLLLVSDTSALLPLSDLVIYVTRAQFSNKNIFPFIRDMKSRQNMPPFGMVLNGLLASSNSSSYGYRYGYRYNYKYRYSYTYKYNYGYGYGYGSTEKEKNT